MNAMVELDDVRRTYPGGVSAVQGISLAIEAGELVAIAGPSGSGKSTLLHLMGTLDRPDSGSVRVDGQDVSRLRDSQLSWLRAQRIGFVFQRFHLPPAVTALDAVTDGLLYAGIARRIRRRRAGEMLERLGLGDRLNHRPHQLSGGEQQRVAVARACLGEPAVLLADEPTGNLDSSTGDQLLALLFELCAAGTAVVVITHNQELASELPRQIEIRDGRVRADRRKDEVGR